MNENFLEVDSVLEANKVNLEVYRFERFSETRQKYIFIKRKKEGS